MDFSKVTEIRIPEGNVVEIAETLTGRILWGNAIAKGLTIQAVNSANPVVMTVSADDNTEYRINGTGDWKKYTSDTTLTGRKISIRCTGKTTADKLTDKLKGSGNYKVYGYLADLLDWKKRLNGTITYADNCFSQVFLNSTLLTDISSLLLPDTTSTGMYSSFCAGCSSLTKVMSKLSALNAKANAYERMFQRCTHLTTAPEIMATTVGDSTFLDMFEGCTALTTVQSKMYMTVADSSTFAEMFLGCSNLVTGVDLSSITSLSSKARSTFYEMYKDCSKLTSATLPTKLSISGGESCTFYGTFMSCTALTTPPAIPTITVTGRNTTTYMFFNMYGGSGITSLPTLAGKAITGIDSQFNSMFSNCTNLTGTIPDGYLKDLTTASKEAYSYMFYCTNITAIGNIFNGATVTVTDVYAFDAMFESCTALKTMPSSDWLVAKITNGQSAFKDMFDDCTALTSAQGIKVTADVAKMDITTNTFKEMFNNCSSMTTATITADVKGAGDSTFRSMFSNCTKLESANVTLGNLVAFSVVQAYTFYNMFNYCTALKEVPFTLSSTLKSLGSYACNAMFGTCTSLTKVPDDFFGGVTNVGDNCCESMFNGCTALADVPVDLLANITTLSNSCYKTMFYNTAVYLPVDLPATNLADNCYYGMYSGCTQMTASTTETSNYAYAWRVPSETDTTSTATTPTSNMFSNIGSATAWSGTPSVNTTYYFWQKGYIKIESDSGTAITFKSTSTASLEYSLDKTTYQTLTASTNVSCPNGVIYLRGLGNTALGDTTFNSNTAGIFTISCAKSDVKISGDMRALLVYNNMANASTLPDGAFSCLFKGSTTIKDVSKLTIGNSTGTGACYSMFRNCSHLAKVSRHLLPAMNIASRVYDCMFMQCSELAEIPEDFLPATTVADRVYEYMFQSCTSLKNTCKINATSLPWGVCYAMFRYDTAITDIPEDMFEVIKETVANDTFSYMFYNDTGITELKAKFTNCTYMSRGACYYMFGSCTGMKTVPTLMFPVLTTVGYGGMANMFNGCTALTNAPELPATIFTAYARTDTTAATTSSGSNYEYMFYNCKSLVSPPSVLPATTPSGSCYHEMFGQCTAMKEAPEILMTTTASSCCKSMFIGCTALVEPPSTLLPTDILYQAYKFMFSGCTALEKTPCIHAKTITGQAGMQGMFGTGVADNNTSFGGCSKLKYLNFAYTITTIGQTSMFGMFNGCTVLEEVVPVSSTASVATNGMYNMYRYTAVSVSATQSTGYNTSWTVPTSTGTSPYYAMFSDTKGSFIGEPIQGTTYYFKTPSYSYLKLYSPSKSKFVLTIYTSNKMTDSSGNVTYPQTEYSFDSTTWYQTNSTLQSNQINVNSGGTLYLRRDPTLVNGGIPLASSSSTAPILRLSGDATDIEVSGKLMSMVNYKNTNAYVDMGISSGVSQALFQCYFKGGNTGNSALKSLKDIILPMASANSMYDYFAYNQVNLTDIPKALPYNGLYTNSMYAYRYMFAVCPKVTKIPYVYQQYFPNFSMAYFMQDCTGICIKDTMDDEYCVPWCAGMFSSGVEKSSSTNQFVAAFRNTANGYNTASSSDTTWYTFDANGTIDVNTVYYTKRAV